MFHYKIKLQDYIGDYEGDITITTGDVGTLAQARDKAAQRVKDICEKKHLDLNKAELVLKVTSSIAV